MAFVCLLDRLRVLTAPEDTLEEIGEDVRHEMTERTIATITNPDSRIIDIYSFEGYHSRIGWKSQQAKDGYVGSYRYGG